MNIESYYKDLNNYIVIKEKNIDLNFLYFLLNFDYLNKPLLNIYNQYITEYNNEYYLVFKRDDKYINIEDISYFLNQQLFITDNNIKEKWCQKIDYHEYQITQFGSKFFLLRESNLENNNLYSSLVN